MRARVDGASSRHGGAEDSGAVNGEEGRPGEEVERAMAGGTWRGGGECTGAWDSGSLARGWSGMRTTPTSSTATADDGTGREWRRAGTSESLLDEEEAEAGATRSRGRSGGLVRLGLR